MPTGTHFWAAPDTTTAPRTHTEDLADIVEALDPNDALAVTVDRGPAVAAALRRRGHRVEHHVRADANGEPRSYVAIDRPPAA
jgi:hypothetical protein